MTQNCLSQEKNKGLNYVASSQSFSFLNSSLKTPHSPLYIPTFFVVFNIIQKPPIDYLLFFFFGYFGILCSLLTDADRRISGIIDACYMFETCDLLVTYIFKKCKIFFFCKV